MKWKNLIALAALLVLAGGWTTTKCVGTWGSMLTIDATGSYYFPKKGSGLQAGTQTNRQGAACASFARTEGTGTAVLLLYSSCFPAGHCTLDVNTNVYEYARETELDSIVCVSISVGTKVDVEASN